MIYFITTKPHKIVETEELIILDNQKGIDLIKEKIDFSQPIALDLETTGLDAYKNKILLVIIGNKENQFVIDFNTIPLKEILGQLKFSLIIGHNIKFDYKFIKVHYNIELTNLYDTMIAEQRILQGTDNKWGLDQIIPRRLGFSPEGMNKTVREDFIGAKPDTFVYENKHIYYAANDIKYLFDLKTKQDEKIKQLNQEFLLYNIEFPLIPILAEAELEGWKLNIPKWRNILEANKEKRFELQVALDDELRKLREVLPNEENKKYLKGGKYDRIRQKPKEKVEELNLFGDMFDTIEVNPNGKKKAKAKLPEPYINYSSTDTLIQLFGRLGQPIPTKEEVYAIPTFKKNKLGKEVIDKTYSFTTGAGAIENYIAEQPNTPMKNFINLLVKYREFSTRINTFGESFITKFLNPVTDKIHTVFRQCNTTTGRLQSGNKDEGYFNSQNIPAEKDFRECFGTDENYNIICADYSGCEAVVMIDKAKDEQFYEYAIKNDDAHSPLAQAVWREIGKFRNDIRLANINISKQENKHLRNEFKVMTFGTCYGMGIKKAAKTLRVSDEEAKIALKTQKSMLPKTFRYLDIVARQAVNNGYVTINNRTNSRVWYQAVFDAKKFKTELEPFKKHEIESQARNVTIQGTNADIVKEAMVELTKEFKLRGLDAKIIGQVHDEIIVKYHNSIKGINCVSKNETLELMPVKDFVVYIMETIANRYLSFITMKAEAKEGLTWTK